MPQFGRIDVTVSDLQLTTITHADRPGFELSVYPRWSTSPFYGDFAARRVFAGLPTWIRYKSGNSDHTIKMTYQINDGEEVEASHYLGGNCFFFVRCFEVNVPEDASGELRYWFSDAPDQIQRAPIIGKAAGKITIKSPEEIIVEMDGRPSALNLEYYIKNALVKVMDTGSVPSFLTIAAEVTENGVTTKAVPVATVESLGHDNGRFNFRAQVARMPVAVEPWTEALNIKFQIKASSSGSEMGVFYDGPYEVSLP